MARKRVKSSRPSAAEPKPRNSRRVRPENRRSEPEPPKPSLKERLGPARERVVRLGRVLKRPAFVLARVLGVAVALVGAVAVGRLVQGHLRNSAAFAVEQITLDGNDRIGQDELLEVAGLAVGQNIFETPPEQVRARLLEHPWIAMAEVSRRLPNRFEVQVREHRAVALLVVEACSEQAALREDDACEEGAASTLYLVGEEGNVFKRLAGEDPVDMPVITGVDRQRFGTDPELRDTVLLESVALLHEYRAAGLWRRLGIAEIHVEPEGGFSLYVGTDLTHIRLGQPPFQKKLRRMRRVFDRLDREEASAAYVYLDNERRPDRVTVRLR